MMYTLRFDVETLIIATKYQRLGGGPWLRFDVETLIIATSKPKVIAVTLLRFDVETLIIATTSREYDASGSCGLM